MPHDHVSPRGGPGRLAPEAARRITSRATQISIAVALTLVLTKLVVWWMSGSVALLASTADSFLDLTASLAVLFAIRYAAEPADADHRFGHGKAEGFASIFQAMLVAVSAALLLREGVEHMIAPQPVEASGWALGVMAFSIALTSGLLVVQSHAIRETGSVAVEGDRAHYLSDLGANLAVMAGIAGSALAGWLWLDGLAAIGVSLWLAHTAWTVARGAAAQLLDEELPDEERDAIRAIAERDPRIINVHELRTRVSGPLIHIQFHLALSPDLPLRDAHVILVECERRLLEAYPAADIMIHADPHGAAEPHGTEFFTADDKDELSRSATTSE